MTKPQACHIHFYCVSIQAFLNERLHMPTNWEPLGQHSGNWIPLLAKGNQNEEGFHTLKLNLKDCKTFLCPVLLSIRKGTTLEISRFCRGAVEAFALLECYTQRKLVASYRHFGTASRSHLQRTSSRGLGLITMILESGLLDPWRWDGEAVPKRR